MNEEYKDKVIGSLARLEEKVDGINIRLDKVNGNIARHEQSINVIKIDRAEEKGEKKGFMTFGKFVWAIVTLLGSGIVAYLIK